MSEWQPIETAPKDGTRILARGLWAGEISGIEPDPTVAIVRWSGGSTDYEGFPWSVDGTDGYAAWMKADGWMPLPDLGLRA